MSATRVKKDWGKLIREAVKVEQGQHKPVLDLYCYHGRASSKFNLLSKHNPDVLHVYVGDELAPLTTSKTAQPQVWNPDEGAANELEQRRLYSCMNVEDFLPHLPDESINRINIDMGFPGKKVIQECMRVLEPGGTIEFGTTREYSAETERVLSRMGLEFKQVDVTNFDYRFSNMFRDSSAAGTKLRKYLITKPGGGRDVDRRMFWERLPQEAWRTL